MRVVVLDTFQDFENLAPQWRDLLDRAAWTSVFGTPEWLLGWWRVFGEGRADRRLRVWTLVDERDRLVGLYPLYAERRGLVRWLRPLGQPRFADMSGIIADRDRALEVHRHFFAWLASSSDWDVARLENVPLESLPGPAPEALASCFWADCLRERGLTGVFLPAEPCMVVSLAGCRRAEDLLAVSTAARYRRKRRKLEKRFAQVEVRQEPVTLETLRLARRFSEERSQAFLDHRSFFSAPGAEELIRTQIGQEKALGLALFFLYLDGELAAYEFAYQRDGVLMIYFRAFDRQYYSYSPGYLLLCQVIDRCLEQGGIHELSLLLGGEAYKNVFSPRAVEQCSCALYNRNPRAWVCRAGHAAYRLAKRCYRALRRFGPAADSQNNQNSQAPPSSSSPPTAPSPKP